MRADDDIGAIIARQYVLREALGSGGAACVYRADDLTTGRAVAIKICRRDRLRLNAALAREATFLQRLAHPNIVRFHGSGELADGRAFLAMDWVSGTALSNLVRGKSRLALEDALDIAEAILAALTATHAIGVLHRDVKPHNVFIPSGDGQYAWRHATLLDYGASAEMDDRSPAGVPRVKAGLISGTPDYIAPEQAMGLPHGPSADIFGVAAILFEILTGAAPTAGPPTTFVLGELGREIVVPAERILGDDLLLSGTGVPKGVRDLIESMLRRDPCARPQTATEILGLIQRARQQMAAA